MKKKLNKISLLLLSLLTLTKIYGQAPETLFEILGGGGGIRTWVYVGGDEFDGDTLDYTKWHNSHNGERAGCSGGAVDNNIHTNGDNIEVSGGTLKLTANNIPYTARAIDYEADGFLLCDGASNLRTFPYTGGLIYSDQKFKYGMFMCEFTAPAGKGLWPAFWLYGPGGEEIDCFELKGERTNEIHYDVHGYHDWVGCHLPLGQCPPFSGANPGEWVDVGTNLTSGTHMISCVWEPGLILWYLDSHFAAYEFVDFYNSMNIIANIGTASATSGSSWLPAPDGTTPFPATFEINYIRAYAVLECEDEDDPFCNYTTGNFEDIALVGTYIEVPTYPTCASGSTINVTTGHSMKMIATDHIVISENFTADEGSYFEAKILECWEDRSTESEIPQYLNLVKDTNFYSRTKPKVESAKMIEQKLKIYPNPTTSSVTVSSNKDDLIQNIKFYDVLGSLIKEFNFADDVQVQIDLTEMVKGLYIVETKTQNSNCKKALIIQ